MATDSYGRGTTPAARPAPRVLLVALSSLATDRRLHRMATSLNRLGYAPALVGICTGNDTSPLAVRPYPTRRLRVAARGGWRLYAEVNVRLFFHLLFARFAVLTANDLDVLPACYLVAAMRRRPLVLDSHEIFAEQPGLMDRPRTKRFWLWLEGLLLPRVKHHVTVNELLANHYWRTYGIMPVAVYNWPTEAGNTAVINPTEACVKKVLLYQGSLQQHRGIALMLTALKLLPYYKLWVVGGGPAEAEVCTLASKLAVTEQVKFWGAVDAMALDAITQQATLGLSLEDDVGLNNRYATPNKVYDYLHAGLPVVVSDLPGHRSIVAGKGCGCMLTERTPEALARVVQTVVEDVTAYAAMHAAAVRVASGYVWETQEGAIGGVYAKAMTGEG